VLSLVSENYFAIAAGMGSLPNHHIGRVSAQPQIRQKSGGNLYRSIDPMAGDVTLYEDHHFQIIRNIQEGQEIFISHEANE
jgi:hypothetical protein